MFFAEKGAQDRVGVMLLLLESPMWAGRCIMEAVLMDSGKKLGTIVLDSKTFSSGKKGYQAVGLTAELLGRKYAVNFMLIEKAGGNGGTGGFTPA